MRIPLTILATILLLSGAAGAAQDDSFDYFEPNRELIRRGVQAVLTCNGLFTSKRSVEQVFEQELAYLEGPIGTPGGGQRELLRRPVVAGPG